MKASDLISSSKIMQGLCELGIEPFPLTPIPCQDSCIRIMTEAREYALEITEPPKNYRAEYEKQFDGWFRKKAKECDRALIEAICAGDAA